MNGNQNPNPVDYIKMSTTPVIENGINRKTDVFTVIIFLCLIFVSAILFWVMPDRQASEDENRKLRQMPVFSAGNLASGKFTGDMGKYYADQFPFRDTFVGAKTVFSHAFFINENKSVVIAKDGYLIQRFDIYSEKPVTEKSPDELGGNFTFAENMANIKNNCGYINTFSENIKELYPGIKLTFAPPPRKIDVMTNKLPAFFPTERHEKYFEELNRHINQDIYVDLVKVLREHNDEYIYYRTDHHWTTLGAYYAYAELGGTIGYEPLSKESFTVETADGGFYGAAWSKAGAKWIKPDIIEYYRTEYDGKIFETKIHGANPRTLQGFYDREKLETKDKYASFLGGINSHISIYKQPPATQKQERILLIADSFGQSLAPFLAYDYNIEIIDARFFNDNIYDFIKDRDIGNILILVNMESLSTQDNLKKLTRR